MRAEKFVDNRRQRPLAFEEAPEFGSEGARGAFTPKDIDSAMFRRRHEPRGGIIGEAAKLPDFQRAAEGVLYDVFRQREVVDSEDAGERRDHASGFVPEKMLVELARGEFHHM